jgi:hypothetical protein
VILIIYEYTAKVAAEKGANQMCLVAVVFLNELQQMLLAMVLAIPKNIMSYQVLLCGVD